MTLDKTININSFDFLRFIFAFNIFLGHLAELSQNQILQDLLSFANAKISINGFFVISGFLVAKSYQNTYSLKSYFLKRAKRILPAYIAVIVLATFLLFFFSKLPIQEYFFNTGTWLYLFWNTIFLNFMYPCLPGVFENNLTCAVNGALWTIKIEEGFYIILPFLFFVMNKIKKPSWVVFSIYLVSVFYTFVLLNYFNKPNLAKQLPGSMAYFSVGIFLFLNFNRWLYYKYSIVLITLIFLCINNYFKIDYLFVYPFVFGIFIIASAYSLQFFRDFGKYGDFTYGIYIYHFPVIQITRQLDLYNKCNPYFIGISVVITVFILAFLSWNLVEKRFLDRYKVKQLT